MSNAEEAVATMQELGLTEYEARCFVGLTQISKGTAKEVSQITDIPRSRVYDTIERLERRGFVETQQSEPREYKAVPIEMAIRRIREDYDSRISAAENALHQVEEPESKDDEGMWAITKPEHVVERIQIFLDNAEESVHHLIASDEVVDRGINEHLQQASERGVSVTVEVADEEIQKQVQESVSGAEIVVSADLGTTNPVYSEWPGQLLMVDKQSIVAAGVEETDLPDVTQEIAVWTYGRNHGFAVWTRELLDDRLSSLGIEQ